MQSKKVDLIIRVHQSSHFQVVKQCVEEIKDLCVYISPKTFNPKKNKTSITL